MAYRTILSLVDVYYGIFYGALRSLGSYGSLKNNLPKFWSNFRVLVQQSFIQPTFVITYMQLYIQS